MNEHEHKSAASYSEIVGLRGTVIRFYGRMLDFVITILIFLMLVTLLYAVWSLIGDVYAAFFSLHQEEVISSLVSDVLSVFVLIELFRTFTDYLEYHRIRLRVLAEVAIVFILRELFIGLYAHRLGPLDLLATAALLAVLVAARVAAIQFVPKRGQDAS
ncbi:phosphate-starvation-inducible PsiE family protein [Acidithiobacillus sp. AMEEHan]|uniref:phosphate-starvation-inducible PsiE family protein n=1 Tax=Acidithiobacillus sp. AMEEHan TaxID=2994951 RepID=UPI0027E4C58E|nr:phosphate-starvation-inducible PsiE family protein [Acidithiobacillus sp. AMEEHan]